MVKIIQNSNCGAILIDPQELTEEEKIELLKALAEVLQEIK